MPSGTPVEVMGVDSVANGALAVNATIASTEVVTGNLGRKSLLLVNYSDTLIWLALDTPAIAGQGIPLQPRIDANTPGGSYEITSANLFTGAIYAIHEGTGNKALVGVEV